MNCILQSLLQIIKALANNSLATVQISIRLLNSATLLPKAANSKHFYDDRSVYAPSFFAFSSPQGYLVNLNCRPLFTQHHA